MKKKFLDPNIVNKSKTVEEKIQLFEFNGKMLPLPTEIEISESGTCNRTCSFCPRSAPDFEDKKEFISNSLNKKLCAELSDLNYKGTIRYSGFVEPLLDKNIYQQFDEAIRDRKVKKILSETTFIGINSAEIKEHKQNKNMLEVTVEFVSEIISCVKDKENKIISGDPEKVKKVHDIWKFSKDSRSHNPNWFLIDTQA